MTGRTFITAGVFLGLLLGTAVSSTQADVEAAKKYLAEATKHVEQNDLDDARTALELAEVELEGVDATTAGPIKEKIDALTIRAKVEGAGAAASEAAAEAMTKLTAAADNTWPGMADKLGAEEGFDPDGPPVGKAVRLKGVSNRMGWDYTSDDLNFATRVNGKPVAGRFDPKVAAAFEQVEKMVGRQLEDTDWDVIGVVERGTVRMNEKKEADVQDNTGTNIGTVSGKVAIEVPYIRIIALRAGPLAVGPDGVVDAEGQVNPVGN